MSDDRIVRKGSLAGENLQIIGASLKKVYRVEETSCFDELVRAIDRAHRPQVRLVQGFAPSS